MKQAPTYPPLNTDRVEKLARLANNNPNEHEANLAARMVCRLLEASGFQYPATVNYRPFPAQEQFYRDVKRSAEPFWRSQPYYATWDTDFKSGAYKDAWNTTKKHSRPGMVERECSKCHKTKKGTTSYTGDPAKWKCADCFWDEYEKEQKPWRDTPDAQ